jgi:hypothetical protein
MGQRVFANEGWYIERPEPEEQLAGTLEPVTVPLGPAGRPALSYLLRTAGEELPVYAAGVELILGSLAGCSVNVLGKRIDFSYAGFATELWIAEIEVNSSKT